MYKLCSTEKSALHQRQLEAAFLTLAMRQNYDNITISAICREAGLSRKVFYRLFETKTDVLYALIDHTLMAFEAYLPDEPPLYRFFTYWKEQKPLLDALNRNQCNALLIDRVIRFSRTSNPIIIHTLSPKLSHCNRDTLTFYVGGIFGLMLDWHVRGYDTPIEEISNSLLTLLTTPLYP